MNSTFESFLLREEAEFIEGEVVEIQIDRPATGTVRNALRKVRRKIKSLFFRVLKLGKWRWKRLKWKRFTIWDKKWSKRWLKKKFRLGKNSTIDKIGIEIFFFVFETAMWSPLTRRAGKFLVWVVRLHEQKITMQWDHKYLRKIVLIVWPMTWHF